jgi:hypothetical protein
LRRKWAWARSGTVFVVLDERDDPVVMLECETPADDEDEDDEDIDEEEGQR